MIFKPKSTFRASKVMKIVRIYAGLRKKFVDFNAKSKNFNVVAGAD